MQMSVCIFLCGDFYDVNTLGKARGSERSFGSKITSNSCEGCEIIPDGKQRIHAEQKPNENTRQMDWKTE